MLGWLQDALDWLFPNRWRKEVRDRLASINALLDEKLGHYCRPWSNVEGYRMPFRPEVIQALTEIERKVRCLPPCKSEVVGIAVEQGSNSPRM